MVKQQNDLGYFLQQCASVPVRKIHKNHYVMGNSLILYKKIGILEWN